ncbi:ABC transporter permease [Streptomyces kunmingensis]|uniref:ABC transporter permease n=1 Tax=Streptomyces kunmingensis TaxID=68225 RepID=A0ABU6CJA2_9ACTN|nr:ABC transporter permease [Streptomyces kunmingensis]MEB3964796.1 ABC transporter permease [Streptomyces kunmingensis]
MSPDTEAASVQERLDLAPPLPLAGRGHDSGGWRLLRFLVRRPGLVLALLVVAALVVAAFWPEVFTGRDPLRGVPAEILRPPSAAHWFGTDELGRDLFARVVHGARVSLRATLVAVAVAFVVGGGLGLVAGFVGGPVESVLMRIVDVLLAVPGLFLSLAVVTALGRGTMPVALAVGVAGVAGFARVTRAEVLRVRHAEYVEAARLGGARWYSVLARHVVRNAAGPVLVLAVLDLGTAVLSVASLSFLGYGAPPPAPEWGTLIAHGRDYLSDAWWMSTIAGLVVAAFVLSTHRISRALGGEWEESR